MATMDLSLMNCEKLAPLSCCTLAQGLKLMLKKKKKLLLEDLLEKKKKKKKTGVGGCTLQSSNYSAACFAVKPL